jgi:dethiobiotin synthetase
MTMSPDTMPIREGLFITGTDAGCGKTAVAAGIIYRLQSRGIIAAGMKPPPGEGTRRTAVPVSIDVIREAFDDLRRQADSVVVEGAGGWTTPLGPGLTFADLARALALPVLLVVRLGPGCVDHALSSARAIRADGLNLAGWIGNAADPGMDGAGSTLVALKHQLDRTPCLGVVDHHARATPEAVARHLRFDRLMAAMDADDGSDQAEN